MLQNKNAASVKANSLFEGVEKNFKININQKDFLEKKEGEIIFRNGDSADHIYLVIDGEVKLKISGVFSSPVIIKSNKDEFFGEKELLENIKRSSSAVADTDCLLFRIEKGTLNQLAGQNRIIKRNLYKSLLIDEPEEQTNTDVQKRFFLKTEESPKKFKITEEKSIEKIEQESSSAELEEKSTPADKEIPEEKDIPGEKIIKEESLAEDEDISAEQLLISAEDEITKLTESYNDFPEIDDNEKLIDSELITEETDLIPEEDSVKEDNFTDDTYKKDSGWNFMSQDEVFEENQIHLNDHKVKEEPGFSHEISEPLTTEEPLLPTEEKITFQSEDSLNKIEGEELQLLTDNVSPESPVKEDTSDLSESADTKELAELMFQDLSYPVSALKFYAEQIKKRDISEELNEVAGLIIEQADIISAFSESAYDFASGKAFISPTPVSINSVLDEVLGLLADYIESRNSRLFKKYSETAVVNLDKSKFYQAIFQVAKLACNSIPEGGGIYVTASAESNIVSIEIRGKVTSNYELTNNPSSVGMKELSGVGLSIAKRIIKEHGGDILINEDEHGSKFVITIPAHQ